MLLPALYQGVEFSSTGTPIRHLHPTVPLPPGIQRERLDTLAKLNKIHLGRHTGDSELEARIQNYELAARMQLAADGCSGHLEGVSGLLRSSTDWTTP